MALSVCAAHAVVDPSSGEVWILQGPARGHYLPVPPVQGCWGHDEVCLGEVARLIAVLHSQETQGLGAELSTAQTSGTDVGMRRSRRAQLRYLLWDPVVLPWVLPLGKWTYLPPLQRPGASQLRRPAARRFQV